jgi:hypothetical protein
MGPWSLCGLAWGSRCTKSAGRAAHTHAHDDTAIFTQVWAAVRRKTLLLLWWIEVEGGDGCEVQVPGRVPRECNCAHIVYDVLVYRSGSRARVEPLAMLPSTSFYSVRGYHSGKTVYYRVIR